MGKKPEINNITEPVYKLLHKENANVVEVSGITTLSDEVLDSLKCGDIVAKQTGNQKHSYIVTYKEDKHGICLTYADGSGYIETVSYDYTEGHWVYNSTDVFQGVTEAGVKGLIRADKDILSQIETDEDGYIYFPENVLPLALRCTRNASTGYLYFSYSAAKLVDSSGNALNNTSVTRSDKRIKIRDTVYSITNIEAVVYILFDSKIPTFNSYYFFNPVTKAGTPLYKHLVTIRGANQSILAYVLYISNSDSSTTISSFPTAGAYYVSVKGQLISTYKYQDGGTTYLALIPYYQSTGPAAGYEIASSADPTVAVDISTYTEITDSITKIN